MLSNLKKDLQEAGNTVTEIMKGRDYALLYGYNSDQREWEIELNVNTGEFHTLLHPNYQFFNNWIEGMMP